MTRAWAWTPGTWGELLQGEGARGRLLVSLPSRRGSLATVSLRARAHGQAPVRGGGHKARQAVRTLLEALGERRLQIRLQITTSLRVGVGHASSSADILSALRATCQALSRPLPAEQLCWIAAQVEPTNPTLLAGACLFDPDRGILMGRAPMPAMAIRQLSCGAAVDTVRARQSRPRWTTAQRRELSRVLELARTALGMGDLSRLAQASTRSALLHAERLERPDIIRASERATRHGALGIAVSHSGSSIVALYPPPPGGCSHG
jgi:L-threonine kinase